MDIRNYLAQVETQIAGLKTEMFEVRQLLKYAFKEDIIEDHSMISTIPTPKKESSSASKSPRPRKK